VVVVAAEAREAKPTVDRVDPHATAPVRVLVVDTDNAPVIAVAPVIPVAPVRVVTPVTPNVPVTVEFPTIVAARQDSVLDNVTAPVTPNVPATKVLPVAAATLNLLVATLNAPTTSHPPPITDSPSAKFRIACSREPVVIPPPFFPSKSLLHRAFPKVMRSRSTPVN